MKKLMVKTLVVGSISFFGMYVMATFLWGGMKAPDAVMFAILSLLFGGYQSLKELGEECE